MRIRAAAALLTMMVATALLPVQALSARQTDSPAKPGEPVVLAHFYIWFDPTSWNRAKSDYPAVGRYSSDDVSTMRDQVLLAKSVGIDGFIVSWKSTEVLDPRLEALIAIAELEDFKLAITYQGLDFNREPLPTARIGDDLDLFIERYAGSPAFDIFEKPLVVWSGTDSFTRDEVNVVTNGRAGQVLIVASEKSVEGYARIADVVDGNLYYWSSVDTETFPGYPQKLIDMANEVRAHDGIWIAPAAPGFDSRLLGGKTNVERKGGATLRNQWEGALASIPDAIGIISWNEFSENTHVEPSRNYGTEALNVVADLKNAPRPAAIDFDSSGPEGAPEERSAIMRVISLVGFAALIVISLGVVRRRQRSTVVSAQAGDGSIPLGDVG